MGDIHSLHGPVCGCILKVADVTYISRVHRAALALSKAGYVVTVLSVASHGPSEPPDRPYRSVAVPIISRRFASPFLAPVRAIEGLARVVTEALRVGADVYLPHDFLGLVVAYIVGRLTGAKVIYNADELEGDRNPKRTSRWIAFFESFKRPVESFICQRIDAVIAADYARAEAMKAWYGLERVEVVRNVSLLWNGKTDGRIRERLGLLADSKVLLYQGALTSGRGLEISVRALSALRSPDVHLVLLGFITDDYRCRLERLAAELAVAHQVHFLPPVPWDDLLNWTADADIMLVLMENTCLSYYYAAPNKFYEAMMVGVSYVASDFPEMRRVHEQTHAGILVDPTDLRAIVDAIKKLLADPGLRNKMGERGRQAALETYNWEAEQMRLINIVSDVLRTGTGSGCV